MPKRKTLKRLTFIFAGAIFLFSVHYIMATFRWKEIIALLQKINLYWFFGAAGASIIMGWLFRTLRWYYLMRHQQQKTSFGKLYLLHALSLSLAMVTPLQAGELIKVEMIKKHSKMQRSVGYGVFLLERISDFTFIVFCTLIYFFFHLHTSVLSSRLMIISLLIVFLLAITAVYFIFKLPHPKIASALDAIRASVNSFKAILITGAITTCYWSSITLFWYFGLRSVAIDIGFLSTLFMMTTVTIVNILSFIPASVGISEVGITKFLMHLKVEATLAQTGALTLRLVGLLVLLLGLLHLVVAKVFNIKTTK